MRFEIEKTTVLFQQYKVVTMKKIFDKHIYHQR